MNEQSNVYVFAYPTKKKNHTYPKKESNVNTYPKEQSNVYTYPNE